MKLEEGRAWALHLLSSVYVLIVTTEKYMAYPLPQHLVSLSAPENCPQFWVHSVGV